MRRENNAERAVSKNIYPTAYCCNSVVGSSIVGGTGQWVRGTLLAGGLVERFVNEETAKFFILPRGGNYEQG